MGSVWGSLRGIDDYRSGDWGRDIYAVNRSGYEDDCIVLCDGCDAKADSGSIYGVFVAVERDSGSGGRGDWRGVGDDSKYGEWRSADAGVCFRVWDRGEEDLAGGVELADNSDDGRSINDGAASGLM